MKKIILILLTILFTGFLNVSAKEISSYDTVKCDSSFSNSCTKCGEINNINKGDYLDNFSFKFLTPDPIMIYEEEQFEPLFTDKESKTSKPRNVNISSYISWDGIPVKSNDYKWEFTNNTLGHYNKTEQGFIFTKHSPLNLIQNKNRIHIPIFGKNIAPFLKYKYRFHKMEQNGDIHVKFETKELCIKLNENGISKLKVDHLRVELIYQKYQNRIQNNVGIKITALTKNNQVVTDYDGTVLIFSESDKYAKFSKELHDNSYTFKAFDKGVKLFNPGVSFSSKGIQDISVYDLADATDSVMGKVSIHIQEQLIQKDQIYSKIDKKISQFILKVQKQSPSQQLKIYKNFINKVDKILSIKKYSKYRKILTYIKYKIQIELKEVQYSILEKGE